MSGDDLRTHFGLLTRVSTTIPVRRIQTMTFVTAPCTAWLKRVGVRVETAGGQAGTPGGVVDREWLAPLVRVADLPLITRIILPELDLDDDRVAAGAPARVPSRSQARAHVGPCAARRLRPRRWAGGRPPWLR